MSDYRAFCSETFGVLGFFFKISEGDEQREVCVLVAGAFEVFIELLLDIFPQRVTPRLDHHASSGLRILCHVGSFDNLLVPFWEIFGSSWRDRILRLFCHVGSEEKNRQAGKRKVMLNRA